MSWVLVVPFLKNVQHDWIHGYIQDPAIRFEAVLADYDHDRSRQATSASQWLDYLRHAARAWFSVPFWRRGVGFITCFPQLPVMVGLLKRLTFSRRPLIAWMFNLGRTYGGAKGVLARFGLKSVNLFIVHSRAEIDSYSEWLGLPRERFIFVPLSIEMLPVTEQEDISEPFVFAMGSANRDYKLLFDTLHRLGHRAVVVAGPHAVQGLYVPPNVTVKSGLTLAECHRLCQRARVNVVPVDNEVTASGQVTLLETMMYGKAVVATRCVGTDDYVEEGVTALTVPAGDGHALAQSIDLLWNDEERRRQLGAAAFRYVREQVSFRGVSGQMHEAIRRAMSARGA